MSENPTGYDLIQDQRIGPMEDILSQAAEPPTGEEFSYPIVGQGWSTGMWRWMTRGIGNGVLYAGGQPYALGGIDNNAQTVQVLVSTRHGTANAILDGFFHELRADKTFALPMPSSGTTTYTIALTFDPRRERTAEGPISIEVYTGTPPTTFGRRHVGLHRITRRANELLSDATFEVIANGISPVVNANNEEDMPDPATVLSGTICVTSPLTRPEIWFARHHNSNDTNQWVSLTSPEWETLDLYAFYRSQSSAIPPQIQRVGKKRYLRGAVTRTDGQNLTTGWDQGWNIGRVPERDRPPMAHRQPVVGPGTAPSRLASFEVGTDGNMRAYSTGHTLSWVGLHGVWWEVE